jgi:NAD(P)H dehydrogenase (quinone)
MADSLKHAIIFAHPNSASFTASMAEAYRDTVTESESSAIVRDLYLEKFDPCLSEDEFPWASNTKIHDDVARERELLKDVNVFALFYPLWLNSPPAVMKGYLERVFGMGFAYGHGRGGNEPLLQGRKLISFSSSGAPMDWMVQTGAWQALRTLFDSHFAAVCGIDLVDHVHFGAIVPGIRADAVATHAAIVRAKAKSLC